jgi:hypothetical protein
VAPGWQIKTKNKVYNVEFISYGYLVAGYGGGNEVTKRDGTGGNPKAGKGYCQRPGQVTEWSDHLPRRDRYGHSQTSEGRKQASWHQ